MKEKRNCSNNMSYPIYQQPIMVPPMGYPLNYPNTFQSMGVSSNTYEQQINNIEQQINLLDQRVTRLEKLGTNNMTNNYNDSNYYMV